MFISASANQLFSVYKHARFSGLILLYGLIFTLSLIYIFYLTLFTMFLFQNILLMVDYCMMYVYVHSGTICWATQPAARGACRGISPDY